MSELPTGYHPALLLRPPLGAHFGNIVTAVYKVAAGVLPPGLVQYPLSAMAAIISWQFMGLLASPSTRAAASRALVFLALAFSALAFSALGFSALGLGFRDAALFCVSVLAAAGMPLASGGGWSLPSLLFVVLLMAAMSSLPKWC